MSLTTTPPQATLVVTDNSLAGLQTKPLKTIQRGHIYAFSGPSGAGRTTIIDNISAEQSLDTVVLPKKSTRELRENELPEQKLTPTDFFREVGRGNFLYWLHVHDNWYMCPMRDVVKTLQEGHNLLLDLPSRVSIELKRQLPNLVTSILIVPENLNMEVLKERLIRRGEDPTKIDERIETGRAVLAVKDQFDYVVENPEETDKKATNATLLVKDIINQPTVPHLQFTSTVYSKNPFSRQVA